MEITVLGCGSEPNLKKAGSSFLVTDKNNQLLLDMGPGSMRNMLKAGVNFYNFKHIIISHFHLDHSLDLFFFLFCRAFISNNRQRLYLYGPKGFSKSAKSIFSKIEGTKLALPFVTFTDLSDSNVKIASFNIKTLPTKHFSVNEKLSSIAVRIEKNGKSIGYSSDTGVCENLNKILDNVDLGVVECSFSKAMHDHGHLNSKEAGEIAQRNKIKKLVVTHLKNKAEKADVKKEVQKYFKGKIVVACDLLKIKV